MWLGGWRVEKNSRKQWLLRSPPEGTVCHCSWRNWLRWCWSEGYYVRWTVATS